MFRHVYAGVIVSMATAVWAQPDPVALMAEADAALKRAGSFSVYVERQGIGSLATHTPMSRGEVTIVRVENDPIGWKFAVKGRSEAFGEQPPREFHTVYDGKVVQSLRHDEWKLIESPASGAGELLRTDGSWIAWWFMRWEPIVTRPFAKREVEVESWYAGETLVGETPCHVVRVNLVDIPGLTEFEAWYFLGRDDHLPRRIDMLYYQSEEIGDGMAMVTFKNLQAGHEVPDSTFRITAPEGYEIEVHKPPTRVAAPAAQSNNKVGMIAPDWTLKDADGVTHRLVDYRGRVVVMDFWATWCHPCILAMPHVQKLHDKFKEKGVAVFGVNCWESGDPIKFMRDKSYTYTLLLEADPIAPAYQVHGIPTFVVIGPDGRIIHYSSGYDPGEMAVIEEAIRKAIESKPE